VRRIAARVGRRIVLARIDGRRERIQGVSAVCVLKLSHCRSVVEDEHLTIFILNEAAEGVNNDAFIFITINTVFLAASAGTATRAISIRWIKITIEFKSHGRIRIMPRELGCGQILRRTVVTGVV